MRKMIGRAMVVAVALALGGAAHANDWQSAATLSGMVGSYAGPPGGKLLFLTLGGTDGYRASGPFTRFVVTGKYNAISIQSGHYDAIGDNPAVGAIISFFDAGGTVLDSWWILGIKRDPSGKKITGLELISGDGTKEALFRVGL